MVNIFNRKKLKNKRKVNKKVSEKDGKILSEQSTFDIVESYKELRTNVMFSISGEAGKVIALTSGSASEGKSTNVVNLSISFAETGAKVIIIDCDLRRPNVERLLGVNKSEGLTNYLVNNITLDNAILKSVYNNLDVITAGTIPPNPSELLLSKKMSDLIEELRKSYDYIFLDTPPVNVVTDASLLSKFTDGYIVVVKQGYAEKSILAETIKKLNFIDTKILGIIFNNVNQSKRSYKNNYVYDAQ